jgi:ABC-type amino acid transport substrate-binding protein
MKCSLHLWRAGPIAALVAVAAIALGLACSSPAPNARTVETTPDVASFPAVGAMLIQACGTLDCHGTVGRNLRLYGDTGLRLSLTDVPSTLIVTTDAEIAQDYASVVGLEPEIMSQVVASGGANPERLTFVRKARGLEAHKGGAVIAAGDSRDRCITSWLQGHADAASCTAALSLP